MAYMYQDEIDAVKRIRDRNPDVSAHTLATRINNVDFKCGSKDDTDAGIATSHGYATFYTTYSRIRRYDAQRECVCA